MRLLGEVTVNAAFVAVAGSGNTEVGVIPLHAGGGLYAERVSVRVLCTASAVTAGTPVIRRWLLDEDADKSLTGMAASLGLYLANATSVSTFTALTVTLNDAQLMWVPASGLGSGNSTSLEPLAAAFVYLGMSGATTGNATYAVTAKLWGR